MQQQRYDVGQVVKFERTPQGGIRVDAYLTRTGVLEYRNADGTPRRELRIPEETFDAVSLSTLEDATVTNTHRGMVGPRNYSAVACGHVSGQPRVDGDRIAASLVIQDETLIQEIESGDKREVSCGYLADFDARPGVLPDGSRYDGIQRAIRYNHVAIVTRGRAGPGVSLRLDAAGDQIEETMTLLLDGKTYDPTKPEDCAALSAAFSALKTRADTAEGERDTLRTLVTRLDADLATAALSPERLDALVSERLALVERVLPMIGKDYAYVGKSSRQIKLDAIRRVAGADSVKDSATDAYVDGRFDGLQGSPPSAGLGAANVTLFAASHGAPLGALTAVAGGVGSALATPTPGVSYEPPLPMWKRPLAANAPSVK